MLVLALGSVSGCGGRGTKPSPQPFHLPRSTAGTHGVPGEGGRRVDFLDYFLQSDDVWQEWTLSGTDVKEASDPDGAGKRCIVLTKWSDPNCYEVYQVDPDAIRIRYEVVRYPGRKDEESWIRRYHDLNQKDAKAGQVWAPRFVEPGKTVVLSTFAQDRFVFDPMRRQYVWDEKGSAKEMSTYLSVDWATIDWRGRNITGFDLDHVLRLTSEWQREGLIFETYDYAKGKGLVNWRWMERVSTLRPARDLGADVFHCEEGFVKVDARGRRPTVWKFDPRTKQAGRELDVIEFESRWKPELGKQLYVVYRELAREKGIDLKLERLKTDYSLPEWAGRAAATIADLPAHFTR